MKDGFLRNNFTVLAAIGLVNLCSLAYHLFMIRALSPAEYGTLNTLTLLYFVLIQPAEVFETVITKFSSYYPDASGSRIKYFIMSSSRKIFFSGLAVFLFLLVFSKPVMGFFNIGSRQLLVFLALAVFFSFISSIAGGILRGYQKFGYFGIFLLSGSFFNLILGILLVTSGFGAGGAMGGWAAAQVFSFAAGTLILIRIFFRGFPEFKWGDIFRPETGQGAEGQRPAEFYKYFVFVAFNSVLFAGAVNLDLFLVKHFFSADSAGIYSIAQMAGKIVLFFPAAISLVMFSRTSREHALGGQGVTFFRKSLFYSFISCGAMVLICLLFPGAVIKLLSGMVYPQCVPLVRWFAAGMGMFALCAVVFNYNLSLQRFGYLLLLVLFLSFEAAAITLFHNSLVQVLMIVAGTAALLFLSSLLLTVRGIKDYRKSLG